MTGNTQGNFWIGTSNIVLPGNKSIFPEEFQAKSRLSYYSSLFNSVELNNTFYKIPMASTFDKWSLEVGEQFRFSVKLWRDITHAKNLTFNSADIEKFIQRTHFIHNKKKGCLLMQFPGKITLEYFNQIEQLLKIVINTDYGHEWQKVIELRHSSWHTGETFELLDAYNAALVLHDFPKGKIEQLNKNAPVMYIRLHGPAGNYKGSYSNEYLHQKAEQIHAWTKTGKNVYAYFNNTAGDAYNNVVTLKGLLQVKSL